MVLRISELPGPKLAGDREAPGTLFEEVFETAEEARVDRHEAMTQGKTSKPRVSAEQLAKKQREISISEFFTKNRHLLGFDNAKKALLTTIKEAVDNALDACEEARVLPDLLIEVKAVPGYPDRLAVMVEDNGPGIVKAQIPKIFGKLLYGSKFHACKMARGQQGIGISAAAMYGELTTGKPITVRSRTGPRKPALQMDILIDTARNVPIVRAEQEIEWDKAHGTRLELEIEAKYQKGQRSVDEYLRGTAIANPHARMNYLAPDGRRMVFERASNELPREPIEIQPHPHGVELGMLGKMAQSTKARQLSAWLKQDFSRVSAKVAREVCELAKQNPKARPGRLSREDIEKLHQSFAQVKILNPPTDCVWPIGEDLLIAGLRKELAPEVCVAATRKPTVYRGNPFVIEAAMAYGCKDLKEDSAIEVFRYANRVPLQYKSKDCATHEALMSIAWRDYGLSQSKGSLPQGPVAVMIHMASVWVPFTSESKEAIASYDAIVKEMRLALQECGRRLSGHLRRKKRAALSAKRRDVFTKYIREIVDALAELTAVDKEKLAAQMEAMAQAKTEMAEYQAPELEDDGEALIGQVIEYDAPDSGEDAGDGDE